MKKIQKLLSVTMTVAALLGTAAVAGCGGVVSSGIAHVSDGKVAVSVNQVSLFGAKNKTPIMYDCSSGSTCVRIGQ